MKHHTIPIYIWDANGGVSSRMLYVDTSWSYMVGKKETQGRVPLTLDRSIFDITSYNTYFI